MLCPHCCQVSCGDFQLQLLSQPHQEGAYDGFPAFPAGYKASNRRNVIIGAVLGVVCFVIVVTLAAAAVCCIRLKRLAKKQAAAAEGKPTSPSAYTRTVAVAADGTALTAAMKQEEQVQMSRLTSMRFAKASTKTELEGSPSAVFDGPNVVVSSIFLCTECLCVCMLIDI